MHRPAVALVAALALFTARPAPGGAAPVALFDQGHGQRFVVEGKGELDLSGLADVFREAGYEVRISKGRLSADALAEASALITSGLFVPYEPTEIQAIEAFLSRGGGLAVMLHVAPPCANLLGALGVVASPGVLYEEENRVGDNPLDFRVRSFLAHPLTEDLAQFSLYGAWAVMDAGKGARTLAFTGRRSWIDADRDRRRSPGEPLHSYGVLVAGTHGGGRFAVFGDDAVFQNRFLDDDNRKLAENLARWLRPGQPI